MGLALTIAALIALALLAGLGAVRSRRRERRSQDLLDALAQTLDRLEQSAARFDERVPPSRDDERQFTVGAIVYTSDTESEHSADLASEMLGPLYRDVTRTVDRGETGLFAGSYGPSGWKLALWLPPATPGLVRGPASPPTLMWKNVLGDELATTSAENILSALRLVRPVGAENALSTLRSRRTTT